MNNEFIPYEQALALKEMGFDEECFSFYSCDNDNDVYFSVDPDDLTLDWVNHSQYDFNNAQHIYRTSAPLYQQAFRWFREKHKLEGLVLPKSRGAVIDGKPIYFIAIISYENELMTELFNSTNQKDLLHYNTKEEAELACLIKLIL